MLSIFGPFPLSPSQRKMCDEISCYFNAQKIYIAERFVMDDLAFGSRNKRGDWTPNEPASTAPLFVFPPKPLALLKWIPSYFFPLIFFLQHRPMCGGSIFYPIFLGFKILISSLRYNFIF